MLIKLLRFASLKEQTIGGLYINGEWCCFSLEDQWQATKVPGETRIPAGEYQLGLQESGRLHEKYRTRYAEHRGMLTVLGVPGFTGIMFHTGATDADTAGCILTGNQATAEGRLFESAVAYRRFYTIVSQAILHADGARLLIDEYRP